MLSERPQKPAVRVNGAAHFGRNQARQAPISAPRYSVFYLVGGKERRTPWFSKKRNADRALSIMKAKYGDKNAIVFLD
jgi:hypothetical protein